ncbi:MAG: PmoA family protein [Planctomycetota bacterium]|nr:PmoA family protein [Planctomycetota bacterium]
MILSTATLFVSLASICSAEPLQFADDSERGRLTVREGETPVLTYNYGKQLKEGVHEKYTRSCYIHPLFDLGGRPLTDDFPKDHFHHRGVFWTWPLMKARGRNVQTWHPSPLRQHFVRWIKREAGEKETRIVAYGDGLDRVLALDVLVPFLG